MGPALTRAVLFLSRIIPYLSIEREYRKCRNGGMMESKVNAHIG